MIVVLFEVVPKPGAEHGYFDLATELSRSLNEIDGFVSVERYESVSQPSKYLSLSFWRDEQAIARWRNHFEHQVAQQKGKTQLFRHYCINVAKVLRQYEMSAR